MNRQKKRRPSHVVVRLTVPIRSHLQQRQSVAGARSIAPVVQTILWDRMLEGRRPKDSLRNPMNCDPNHLFLSGDLVQLIRTWAKDDGCGIADMVFTLLSEDYENHLASGR